MPFKRKLISCLLIGFVIGLIVSGHPLYAGTSEAISQESPPYRIEAERWDAAERIFRSDPRWLGGDGATSVDLGQGRVLWLFGDSLIDLSGKGERRESGMIRNSIAVQTGYDPVSADMRFFWKMKGKTPAEFFSRAGDHWFWPASGVMVGKRLIVFLMEIQTAKNAFGFDVCGWKALMVDNPQKPPDQWTLTYLKSPQKDGLIVGSGNPILENGFLYVFATDSSDMGIYLVRWPENSALAGTLTSPEWWAGDKASWVGPGQKGVTLHSIMENGQMEFSVGYWPQLNKYIQIQTLSIQNPCLAGSTSKALTGPWTPKACFFTPIEQGNPDLLAYAGKSHSMVKGAELVFTYVVNATKTDRLLKDMSIYFPIILRGRIITNPDFPPD